MPRANRYFIPGKCYHLTHRCHDREFLLRFACDRNHCRRVIWKSLKRFPVDVLGYCVTSNHTHFLVYIELNMVRAGVVTHPEQWPWCSYAEWMNQRQRYGIVNKPAGLEILGQAALSHFQSNYRQSIEEMIAQDRCRRESQWTESIAVGSPKFLLQLQQDIPWRRRFETEPFSTESWALRETSPAWNA